MLPDVFLPHRYLTCLANGFHTVETLPLDRKPRDRLVNSALPACPAFGLLITGMVGARSVIARAAHPPPEIFVTILVESEICLGLLDVALDTHSGHARYPPSLALCYQEKYGRANKKRKRNCVSAI